MSTNTTTPQPTEWHRRPKGHGSGTGPCPVCGLPRNHGGWHRAVIEDRATVRWVKRNRDGGADTVVRRPRARKQPKGGFGRYNASRKRLLRKQIAKAVFLHLEGKSIPEIAETLDVASVTVYHWQKHYRPLWEAAVNQMVGPMKQAAQSMARAVSATVVVEEESLPLSTDGPIDGPGAMLLADYANRYLLDRPGLSTDYRRLMRATVRAFNQWARRSLRLGDVTKSLMAGWGTQLLITCKPATVNDKVRMIRTLLAAAYDDELLDKPPRRVRRVPERQAPPEAWTFDEVRDLLDYLRGLPDKLADVPAAEWWGSLVLTVYWTGARIGALLRVEVADYTPGVGLVARTQKNGRQQWYKLPQTCCEAIERVLPDSGGSGRGRTTTTRSGITSADMSSGRGCRPRAGTTTCFTSCDGPMRPTARPKTRAWRNGSSTIRTWRPRNAATSTRGFPKVGARRTCCRTRWRLWSPDGSACTLADPSPRGAGEGARGLCQKEPNR